MIGQKVKKDFFFGDISLSKNGVYKELNDVMDLANEVSGKYFTTQLNRILHAVGGKFILSHDSSCPDFNELLSGMNLNNVGKVEIEQHTDLNPAVPCTLACKLYLDEGVLDIQAQWCAYKQIRAEEIFSSLIAPLHKHKLANKTFLIWSDTEKSRLDQYGTEYVQEVREILLFASGRTLSEDSAFVSCMAESLYSADQPQK